jgi:hypothetical protein
MKYLNEIIKWFTKPNNGLRPLIEDVRDLHFKELLFGEYEKKATSKRLAPIFIENQYYLQVCSFEAWANALAIYFGKPVSVRYLVSKAWQQNLCEKYGGANLRSGGLIAKKFGVVFEVDCPSDERMTWEDFIDIDFHNLDELASKNKIGSFYRVDTPSDLLQSIDRDYAVVIGRDFRVPYNFQAPYLINRTGNYIGPHGTVCVGYDNDCLLG